MQSIWHSNERTNTHTRYELQVMPKCLCVRERVEYTVQRWNETEREKWMYTNKLTSFFVLTTCFSIGTRAPAHSRTRAHAIFNCICLREWERAWNWYMEEYLSNPIPMAIRRIWHFSDAIYFYKIFAIDLIRLKVENGVFWELVSANSREKLEKLKK